MTLGWGRAWVEGHEFGVRRERKREYGGNVAVRAVRRRRSSRFMNA